MEVPSNIYKYNLEILKNLEYNQTIYYEDNKIYLEDRYLGFYRAGNNIVKIKEIIKLSFLHYFNLLSMDLINNSDDKNKILELLRGTVTGLKTLINNYKDLEKDNEQLQIECLKLDLIKILIEYNDKPNANFKRIETDSEEDSDSDSENCLRNMLKTTQEHLQMNEHNIIVNTIYVAKNKVVGTLLSIINYIFDMTNF